MKFLTEVEISTEKSRLDIDILRGFLKPNIRMFDRCNYEAS